MLYVICSGVKLFYSAYLYLFTSSLCTVSEVRKQAIIPRIYFPVDRYFPPPHPAPPNKKSWSSLPTSMRRSVQSLMTTQLIDTLEPVHRILHSSPSVACLKNYTWSTKFDKNIFKTSRKKIVWALRITFIILLTK